MKRVVSVSIGSSRRDHAVTVELLGERVRIERRGTDGDLNKAMSLIRELDGQVDCIGLGGIDLYIFAGGRRYVIRDAKKLANAARRTPVVDGSGLKNTLERWVVQQIRDDARVSLPGRRVLMVAAVDRFGMAEELSAIGCQVTFGDLIFALGIPVPIHSLRTLAALASVVAPVVTKLPFKMLYPTGSEQERSVQKYSRYFERAELIAGDFHYIRRYLPERLDGKGIMTNTVTAQDIDDLARRGARYLVTTTPSLEGRSFGTNVLEATLIAVANRRPEELQPSDYLDLIHQMALQPRIEWFNQ